MELEEAARTAATVRYYRSDPVDDAVVTRLLELARFAPSGGNRQAWHVVVVTDPDQRRAIRDLYLPPWEAYTRAIVDRAPDAARLVRPADHFAQHLDAVPVHLLVWVELAALALTDDHLDRPSIVGGASIYPFVQNLLLAARAAGLGATMTTMLCRAEPAVRELTGMPPSHALACMVSVGYPEPERVPRMRRAPVADFTSRGRFGTPFVTTSDAPGTG